MPSNVTDESTVTLKELNPTRWAGRLLAVLGMTNNYITILKLLTTVNLKDKRRNSRNPTVENKH